MSKRVVISGQEWQLVPVEPTEDMTAAGFEALMAWDVRTGDDMGIEDTYSAMLAAAPTPPAQAEPSDEEIDAIAASMPDGAGGMLKQWGYRQFARALLARYGRQQAASAEPVAWVAADTLNSPHPTCVSSLAYMSQLDKDRGREYVPLYAAPVAAQTAAELAECRSAVAEVLALLERSLAVIQHDIDEIGGCDHSVGICCCELIHLADDIRAAMQSTSGGCHG